jgi:hypothetical protein
MFKLHAFFHLYTTDNTGIHKTQNPQQVYEEICKNFCFQKHYGLIVII